MRMPRAVSATVVVLAATAAVAAGPMHGQEPPAACRQAMDEVRAADARFAEHIKRMNETQGAEKIDAMAAALNELAAEHRAMHEHAGAAGCPMGHMMMH